MALDQWMQVWVTLPANGVNTHQTTLYWFNVSGFVDITFPLRIIFQEQLQAWVDLIHVPIYGSINSNDGITIRYYIFCADGLITGECGDTIYTQVSNLLPCSVSVIIQRLVDPPGVGPRGRVFCPGPLQDWITDGKVNFIGLPLYQNAAFGMIQPFSIATNTFTPALASYARGVITDLTATRVVVRCGNVLRRAKHRKDPTEHIPKPPPVPV